MVVRNESADDGIQEIKRDADEDAGDYFFHVVVQAMVKKNDAFNEESHHSASQAVASKAGTSPPPSPAKAMKPSA
jgi:hypothetical protein